ncbi:cytochrome b561 [Rhizobium leguminosarum]|nr:cytochrome b561 [Rhizobium leguminosarum]
MWQEWLARGVGMIALSGAAQSIFGAGMELPDFHLYPPRLPHGLGANLLLGLLFTHVGAALFHQFIRSDGLLSRMWYGR